MEYTTIGLDVSLTGTGFVLKRGQSISVETIKTEPKDFPNDLARMAHIRDAIMGKIPSDVQMICVEDFFTGIHAGSGVRLAMLAAVIRTALWETTMPFVVVAPTSLKKYILGKGVGEKNLILREVYKKYGIDAKDDNQADAIVLSHVAEQIYCALKGVANDLPKYQKEVVDGLLKNRSERGYSLPS